MVTDLEASNLTDSTVQYVKGYDAYLNGESDTFEGLHLIDDKTFSVKMFSCRCQTKCVVVPVQKLYTEFTFQLFDLL